MDGAVVVTAGLLGYTVRMSANAESQANAGACYRKNGRIRSRRRVRRPAGTPGHEHPRGTRCAARKQGTVTPILAPVLEWNVSKIKTEYL
jgi:hypothetical protein